MMEQFKRIGVFLNQEPGDDEAISFAGRIGRAADSETMMFILVRGLENSPIGPEPTVEDLRARITKILPDAQYHRIELSSATGLHEILRCARDLNLDLIVVGRRLPSDQLAIGSVFYRLARKAPCSVLLAPEHARTHLSRLLVMVDFSKHSKCALETALTIARSCGEPSPQVVALTTYRVGYGYRYGDTSFHDAANTMKENASQKLAAFLADLDTSGVQFESVVASAESGAASVAMNLASARNMDAIVVGSRGMSRPAAALLGSTAERVVAHAPLPVLIVKRKGETTRLLEAFLYFGDGD